MTTCSRLRKGFETTCKGLNFLVIINNRSDQIGKNMILQPYTAFIPYLKSTSSESAAQMRI